jgi:hypothetical protein
VNLAEFHNRHAGETCLIVGVGPNLKLTPPEWFNYPSFGVNTIYRYEGWTPTYYVGVDERLRLEDGAEVVKKYRDIPKFFPRPDWDELQGENIHRFYHPPAIGGLFVPGRSAKDKDALTKTGILYYRIMDAVFQIAWHMGFATMLMIGVQHKPNNGNDEDRSHFWGVDVKAVPNQSNDTWFEGYETFTRAMNGVKVLNISDDTYVPVEILPRDDWRSWANA